MKTKLILAACLLSAYGGYQIHVRTAQAVVIDRPFFVETRHHDCRIEEAALQVSALPALKPIRGSVEQASYVMDVDSPLPPRKPEVGR